MARRGLGAQGQPSARQLRITKEPAPEHNRQAARTLKKTEKRPEPVKKKSMPSFLSRGQDQASSQSSELGWGSGHRQLGAVEYGTKDATSEPTPDGMLPGFGPFVRTLQRSQDSKQSIAPVANGHEKHQSETTHSDVQILPDQIDHGTQHADGTEAEHSRHNPDDATGDSQENVANSTIASPNDSKTSNTPYRFKSNQSLQPNATSQLDAEPSFGIDFGSDDKPYQPPPASYQPPEHSRMPIDAPSLPASSEERTGKPQASPPISLTRTGYRARVLDPQHSQTTAPSRPRDHWPHFQKLDEAGSALGMTATPTVDESPPQQQQQKSVDIDQIFEQYRSARDLKNLHRRPLANPSQTDAEGESSRFLKQRCGLCGERGHLARACPTIAKPQSGSIVRYETSRGSDSPLRRMVIAGNSSAQEIHNPQPNPSNSRLVRREDELTYSQSRPAQRVPQHDYRDQQMQPPAAEAMSTYTPNVPSMETRDDDLESSQRSTRMRAERFFSARDDESEVPEQDRLSAFEEAKQRMLRSSRFSNAPVRQERASRRRSYEDEDDYYERDDEEEIDTAVLAAREARKAEKQAKRDKARREREAAARNSDAAKAINLPDYISVSNLAQALNVHYDDFIGKLEQLGYDDVFPGKILNSETSAMIAMEYGFDPLLANEAESEAARDMQAQPIPEGADLEYLPARPPVVTIMGHVDHGKTTILDYLRNASVAAGEAGGITQHIGAFSVALEATGRTITFLDTPGHAAFLAMRQRGANVTDIVVLVVAADDSVKPQTLEALKHARAANVPIIVAINKVDKPEADVQRVKSDLGRHGVEIEDYGGDTQVIEVSGKTGKGMEDLEEAIVTQSEILDHRADTNGVVEGWVLEATTKPAGRVATVLVRRGTLKIGSILVAGKTWTRVRSLRNDNGVEVQEATPGIPVEVDGWRDQPAAGDEVLQAETEQRATAVVEYRIELDERKKLAEDTEAINDARMLEQLKRDTEKGEASTAAEADEKQSGPIKVPFVIKADVSGSAEAIEAYIMGVSSPLITPQVLYSSVGQINENDIELASVANGVIIAFNLPSDQGMKAEASARDVRVMEHNIIYRVLDEVKEIFSDKLPPIITQKVLGEAEISMPFEIGIGGRKKVKIAGCKVRNGVVAKSSRVRVMRNMVKVYDGSLSSLKNVKKDVQEMRKGSECGLAFEGWEGFEIGDLVQTYQEISEKRTL
ncbi:hypothetical protein AMS68_005740 [Peltaster fructicola]|uniref:Translation initiation factor IF-2, mitochondrial n=1 Tax=Peltaster fructicola TaxID=286661 RepID=A0A6H0XZN7_9PEZI|nr:hypothetical protein AMS68_005740 [Peltaster fructicola]